MILTPRLSNSGLIFAMYPSSVVHTGVKSFGCENSTAHLSPIQSWNLMRPSVVSASKSGAVSPNARAMRSSVKLEELRPAYRRHHAARPSHRVLFGMLCFAGPRSENRHPAERTQRRRLFRDTSPQAALGRD